MLRIGYTRHKEWSVGCRGSGNWWELNGAGKLGSGKRWPAEGATASSLLRSANEPGDWLAGPLAEVLPIRSAASCKGCTETNGRNRADTVGRISGLVVHAHLLGLIRCRRPALAVGERSWSCQCKVGESAAGRESEHGDGRRRRLGRDACTTA
jgi:hypothetical protein